MEILFISDYVCPYCLVAKEAMKCALKEIGIDAAITWHPFELTVEPAPRIDTYHDEVRKSHYQVLVEPCKELGLDMKLPPHVVPRPYTRLAFEGYFYAAEHGCGDRYNDLMYKAYFIDEKDIGDIDVLCGLANEAGLDADRYRKALEEGIYKERLEEANRRARQDLHVKHVPTIYADGKEIEVDAYRKEAFMAAFGSVKEPDKTKVDEKEENEPECAASVKDEEDLSEAGGGCGPNGCSF